jgi:hypothetical protein
VADNPTKTYVDFVSTFSGGQNAGIAPLLLGKDQAGFLLNTSLRGGYAHTRPPVVLKNLNYQGDIALQAIVEDGLYQGGGYYRPDFGTEFLLAQIAGHLISFVEVGNNWIVTDVSVPGDLNDPAGTQVWMWQSEKWMIVNDGSGKLPIFFDGANSRRSFGPSQQWGNVIDDFIPPPIGETVTLTLDAPYTGLYNVPVLLNGAFYQAIQGGVANSYPVVLTNVSDTPGGTEGGGSQIAVIPANIGITTGPISFSFPGPPAAACYNSGFTFTAAPLIAASLLPITPVVANFFSTFGGSIQILVHSNGFASLVNPFCSGPTAPIVFPVQLLKATSSTAPTVVLGNLVNDLTAPAVGASVTVNITQPYTGAANQPVWINGTEYLISQAPPGTVTNILTVLNLTDTTNSPEPQYPTTVTQPQPILSVPELPAGRMGAYGMGRNWESLTDGISYVAGDIVGGPSGSSAYQNRDSVLKMTENTFLAGGGSFKLPGSGDLITAMVFPPNLDTSLGQGPLQIFTSVSCFSNNAPIDRTLWESVTLPLQTISLKGNGALAQNSTVLINSDTFFRSFVGYGSLVLARRDFGGWGNKSISNEMQRPLQADNQSLLPFGSAMDFDNRFIATCAPNTLTAGTFHVGLCTLNFDLISSLRTSLPPAWEGTWTGINSLQIITGRINGSSRAFSFTYNITTKKIELWEMLSEAAAQQQQIFMDNNVTPILWLGETSVMFNKDIKPLTDLCELIDGEIYISNVTSNLNVKVYYRPDFYPCWTLWNEFNICADDDNTQGDGNKQPGYRMRIGLGSPSIKDCESGNNRPMRVAYFHQFRIEFTGYGIFRGLRVKANAKPQPDCAPVECEVKSCQLIDCVVPDDLQIYSLQGFIPQPLPTPAPPPFKFGNDAVAFNDVCPTGTLTYTGAVPGWITMDVAGNRFTGRAGAFGGATQAEADATAQAALNQFVTFNIANGNITCPTPPPVSPIVEVFNGVTQLASGDTITTSN